MKKRSLCLCLAAVMAVTVLTTACDKKETANSDGGITISIGGTPAERTEKNAVTYDIFQENVAKMKELYPEINVVGDTWDYDIKNYMTKAEGNDLPTLYTTSPTEIKKIVENGYATDITKFVKEYGYEDALNNEQYGQLYMRDGKYYGIVKNGSLYNMGMMYNIDLFKQAGLVDEEGIPKYPQTWEELAQTAKIIKEKTGKTGFVVSTKDNHGGWLFMNIMWAFGTEFMEEKDGKWVATFASDEGVNALQYLKDLKWKHNVLQNELLANISDGGRLIAIGEAAMAMSQMSMINSYVTKYGLDVKNLAMSKLPAGPAGRYSQVGANIYMFSGTEEEVDACFKWLDLTGNGPTVSEEKKAQLEKSYADSQAKGLLVGVPSSNIWIDGDRNNAEREIMKKYATVDEKFFMDYVNGEGVEYRFEPEKCVQQLYSVLDAAIQKVLLDEKADCREVLENAQKDFQANYLDRE